MTLLIDFICQGVSPVKAWTSYHTKRLKKWKYLIFFHEKLGQKIISGIEKLQFAHAQILQTSNLGVPKYFFGNFGNIAKVSEFHDKIPSRSEDVRNFSPGGM